MRRKRYFCAALCGAVIFCDVALGQFLGIGSTSVKGMTPVKGVETQRGSLESTKTEGKRIERIFRFEADPWDVYRAKVMIFTNLRVSLVHETLPGGEVKARIDVKAMLTGNGMLTPIGKRRPHIWVTPIDANYHDVCGRFDIVVIDMTGKEKRDKEYWTLPIRPECYRKATGLEVSSGGAAEFYLPGS